MTSSPILTNTLAKYSLPDMTVGDLENSQDPALRIIGLLMLRIIRAESTIRIRAGYDTDNYQRAIARLDEGSVGLDVIHGNNFVTMIEATAAREALVSLLDEALGMYAYKNALGTYADVVFNRPPTSHSEGS